MTEIGPVQMIAFQFGPDAKFEGHVVEELARLEDQHTVRVLDLLFVMKDAASGDLIVADHQEESIGAIAGALLGFDFDGDEPRPQGGREEHAFGLTSADIQGVGAGLAPGSAAAFVLLEHVWARDLKKAIRDAGGVPMGEGFLTPETLRAVEPEVSALVEAMESETAATSPAA